MEGGKYLISGTVKVAGKGGKGMVPFRLFPNNPLKYMTAAYSSQLYKRPQLWFILC